MRTDIDAAWHPSWVGSRQVRYFALDGDRLTLTSEVQEHPVEPGRKLRAVITWERERTAAAAAARTAQLAARG